MDKRPKRQNKKLLIGQRPKGCVKKGFVFS